MATKDWNQRPNRDGAWAYEKSKTNFIYIQKNHFMNTWIVSKNISKGYEDISKGFKTKPQAIRFAKAYMSKN